MKDLIKKIEALLNLHACEMEGIGSGMPTKKQWYDAVSAVEEELKRIKSLPEPIHAKALRKKGTDIYYRYAGDGIYLIAPIPEALPPICYPIPKYGYPPDAELVDIEIRIVEPNSDKP